MTPITVQEQHLPGDSLEEKFAIAQTWGFDGIEL
jgi:sugar phosphate isomerase/epimerase